jgi:hypothetical protein
MRTKVGVPSLLLLALHGPAAAVGSDLGDAELRKHVPDVAFGSLLHMVQDSFSASHADRMSPADGNKSGASSPSRPPIAARRSWSPASS